MTVEGAVAIAAGIVAGSIALIGFGLDSAIEGFASVIIIWRFTGHRMFSHAAEQRAQKLVAVQFFVLAPYVGVESVRALLGGEHPEVSSVGIGARARLGDLHADARHRQAAARRPARLGGDHGRRPPEHALRLPRRRAARRPVGNALVGAWWLDPTVGLLIAAVAVKEGVEAWRGEGCCVASPLDGAHSPTTPAATTAAHVIGHRNAFQCPNPREKNAICGHRVGSVLEPRERPQLQALRRC